MDCHGIYDSSDEEFVFKMLLNEEEEHVLKTIRQPRSCFIKRTRSNYFWNNVYPELDVVTYKHYYRKSKESMNKLTDMVNVELEDYADNWDKLHKIVCMTVEYLAHKTTILLMSAKYCFSDGLVHRHLQVVLKVLAHSIHDQLVTWPSENERHAISNRFIRQRGLPMCTGVIDGTLVKSFGYYHRRDEMNTRKCFYGFNVVLICDDTGLVRQGWYDQVGSEADSTILRESTWYQNINAHLSNSNNPLRSFYILSDKEIQGYIGVVTPFVEQSNAEALNAKQLFFNKIVQQSRALIERVIGLHKSR